ncbi:MAG: 3-deoxy-D-manno-octulosonic acid transferase [Pontiellaceae bacterium]|nr:3-deoxy-D-manno-octulosonic acid transferase [Pontiellaceae bacterium]
MRYRLLMSWFFYNLLFPIVFICMLPKFISRMLKRGGYGQHFEQRIGHFGHNTKARLREHRRIWVHAVSVGEIYVALRFIKAYRQKYPEAFFALSTTTSTAHAIGRKEIDERDVLFYFPVDLPVIIRKVLRIINPVRIVLVEGEFWPNLIRLADKQGIPISLINGRMSASSHKGYRRLRALTADVLQRIRPICVQGEQDAERMIDIGAPADQIHIMGTVKFDVAELDPQGALAAESVLRKLHVLGNTLILLGGSTWPGEESILLDIYLRLRERHPELFLVLVPRHMERSNEVVDLLNSNNVSFARRSTMNESQAASTPDILLIDTTGDLRNFYAQADIVFVGKSLCDHGGQNPIEPAMEGKAVLVGPNMENFPAVMAELLQHEAILQINSETELETTIERLIQNNKERLELGRKAAQTVEINRGVIGRTIELLEK